MNVQVIKYDGRLSEILPVAVDKKNYNENDLTIIKRGVQNPIVSNSKEVSLLLMTLETIAHNFGFGVDTSDTGVNSRFKACAEVVLANYGDLSLEQIKHAFKIVAKTGVNIESYGRTFDIPYTVRVLNAYKEYMNVVLPALEKAEKIAENRAKQLEKRQKAEERKKMIQEKLQRQYYIEMIKTIINLFEKVGTDDFEIKKVDYRIIKTLSQCNLVGFSKDDKLALKAEAEQLTRNDLTRELTQIESEKKEAIQKISRKRQVVTLRNSIGTPQRSDELKSKVNIWWCRVGLRDWLIEKRMENVTAEQLKNDILTSFVAFELINESDYEKSR